MSIRCTVWMFGWTAGGTSPAWNLIAYLDIQNIYNYKNTGSVRWNAREQRVEINDSSIGILPSIGVSAEF